MPVNVEIKVRFSDLPKPLQEIEKIVRKLAKTDGAEKRLKHMILECQSSNLDDYWDNLSFLRQHGLPLPTE